MRYIFAFIFVFTGGLLCAQPGQHHGGANSDYGYQVEATADGGFVVAGRTYSYGAGSMDYWLVKFDSTGSVEWDTTYGTTTYDQLLSLRLAADGGYLLSGLTGIFNSGQEGAWLYKIKPNKDVEWHKGINYGNADHAHILFESYEGGYYMAGHTDSKGDQGGDIWVVKLDSARNIIWDNFYGPQVNAPEHAHAAALTPDSGIIVLAHTSVQGLEKFRVVKINKSGGEQWAKTYSAGNNVHDSPYEIRITAQGHYALSGGSQAIGGATGRTWLKVIDTAGNSVLDKLYGDPAKYNFCWSMRQTDDNGFMMIGLVAPGVNGGQDLLLQKADAAGNLQWQREYGGSGHESGFGFAKLNNNKYVLVGGSQSFSNGDDDMWILFVDSLGNLTGSSALVEDIAIKNLRVNTVTCDTTFNATVILHNTGTGVLNSAYITYKIDNGPTLDSVLWTGVLNPEDTTNFLLTGLRSLRGKHNITAAAYLLNTTDLNPGNNKFTQQFLIDTTRDVLSINETFEDGLLPPAGWQLSGDTGLLSIASPGFFGQKSMKVSFWGATVGRRVMLTSPLLHVDGPTVEFGFHRASPFPDTAAQHADTILIDISTNCGQTWDSVDYTYAPGSTHAAPGPFEPDSTPWMFTSFSMGPYIGQEFLLRITFISGGINNLYIDNIKAGMLVGVDQALNNPEIKVYPNPAGDYVNISTGSNEPAHVSLVNVVGETVLQKEVNDGSITLSTSNIAQGLYFVLVEQNGLRQVKKIMVQH